MNSNKVILISGHILFWLFNYWLVALGSDFNWNGFSATDESLTYAYTYGLFLNAVLFYAQVFWLYPRFYQKKKRLNFYALTILLIVAITLLESYGDALTYEHFNINKPYLCGFISSIMVHVVYVTAGFYYALKIAFKKSEKLRQKLLEENYKSELKYLKAQLNPHFLFNGINSVYHLIGKNNTLAKETLHQFSDLLRYQLYESNAQILLEKELNYVSKYIKIEQIRRGSDIRLDCTIKHENSKLKLAPLLLIPFIENAFKHCSNHIDDSKNTIKIKIVEVEGKLYLNVINSCDKSTYNNKVGGIGLTNVKKRLALLYPYQHQLIIDEDNTHYKVDLSINL